MRDILTGLAIILIVVLTTLLVAPYFVDWNGQRAFLETQLSRAFGQTVTIGGSIDLKLLPTPYIRLNQTVIGSDEGAVRVGIHHLDLELAVAPLLHGEFDVVEGRLEEPTIRLTLQADGTLPAFPETPALKADIRLERIAVTDGTLAVADPASGRTLSVDHLDFTADAPSLAGPFKGNGAAGADAGRTKFRFSTTEAKNGRSHVHLALGETSTHPGVDLDGDVTLKAANQGVRQSFDGTVTAIGHLLPADGPPLAWRLAGPLEADPAGARLAGGELRLGGEDGLAFKADVAGTFGAEAAITATLSAQQLDVDRLSGPPADPAKPNPPPQLPSPSRLRALAAAAMPPVPVTLDVSVDDATWGGEALGDLALHIKPAADGAGTLRASGDAPGGLHLALDGALTGDGTGFAGRAKLGATDLPQALAWLAAVAPDLAPSRGALPFAQAALSGVIDVDAAGLTAKDATLDLDRSHLSGSLRLAFGDGTRQPRLAADLRTDRLDLDALPEARGLGRDAASLAFDLKLAAGATRIASFGTGALNSGRVTLDVAGSGGRIALRSLRVEDFGGATLAATGSLAAGNATFDAKIDADRLDAAAALARQVAPGPWADALAARAATLAPAHLRIAAALAPAKAGGKLAPARLSLDGTLAGTRVAASLAPEGDAGEARLSATTEASDGVALLRQLGLPIAPTAAPIGGGRLALSANGDIEGPLATRLDAGLGATRLTVDGRFDLVGKGEGGSGTATLKSPDLAPLLRALGLTSTDSTSTGPADLAGALALGQNGIAFSDIKGKAAGTGVAGTLKLGPPSGEAPVLTGTLDLDRLSLGALAGLALGPGKPPAVASAWSNEPFATAPAPPRAELSLRARALDLLPNFSATDAALDLRLGPGLVAVSHADAALGGGRLGGGFVLRRDGRQATLEGTLTADKVALGLPALAAAGLTGKLDVAGGGGTALALVASLAGSGTASLKDIRVPGADLAALPRVLALVEEDALAVDEEAVVRAFDEAAKAPLAAGSRDATLGLAGGTLTLTPAEGAAVTAGPVSSEVGAALDLRTLRLVVRATETLHALPKDWSGPPPSIVVTQAGPLATPRRGFDVAAFLNAVAARAIARESARLETYEFDIRERALFAARLQSEHRREADRLKAEADIKAAAEAARRAVAELARKAEADRRAKAEATRLEKQREDAAPAAPASPEPQGFQPQPPGTSGDPAAAGRY